MSYDEESFWVGVTLGQQLKGWASAGEGGALSEIEVRSGTTDFDEVPADGFYGIGRVTVKGEPNLIPENVKKGVPIFVDDQGDGGFVGTYDPSPNLQKDAEVEIKYNGTTTVFPTRGYDGMDKLKVTTAVPTELNLTSRYRHVTENGNYEFKPDGDYNGLSIVEVDVNVPLDAVLTTGTTTIKSNGTHYVHTPDDTDGMTMVTIHAQVPTNVEEKRIEVIQENDTYHFGPKDSSYAGIEEIEVRVNVPTTMDLQHKDGAPYRGSVDVWPDDGRVLSGVTINWDSDITPENIREDVTIYGVRGTYQSPMGTLDVVLSTDPQEIKPTAGIYGYNLIRVPPLPPSGDYNEGYEAGYTEGVASQQDLIDRLYAQIETMTNEYNGNIQTLIAERDAAYQAGYEEGANASYTNLDEVRF